jgi:hypothetical protein
MCLDDACQEKEKRLEVFRAGIIFKRLMTLFEVTDKDVIEKLRQSEEMPMVDDEASEVVRQK